MSFPLTSVLWAILALISLSFDIGNKRNEDQVGKKIPIPHNTIDYFRFTIGAKWELITTLRERNEIKVVEKTDKNGQSTQVHALLRFVWIVPNKDCASIINSRKNNAAFKIKWPESNKVTFKADSGDAHEFILSTSPITVNETIESPTVKLEAQLRPGVQMLVVPVQLALQLIEKNEVVGQYYLRDETAQVVFRSEKKD